MCDDPGSVCPTLLSAPRECGGPQSSSVCPHAPACALARARGSGEAHGAPGERHPVARGSNRQKDTDQGSNKKGSQIPAVGALRGLQAKSHRRQCLSGVTMAGHQLWTKPPDPHAGPLDTRPLISGSGRSNRGPLSGRGRRARAPPSWCGLCNLPKPPLSCVLYLS